MYPNTTYAVETSNRMRTSVRRGLAPMSSRFGQLLVVAECAVVAFVPAIRAREEHVTGREVSPVDMQCHRRTIRKGVSEDVIVHRGNQRAGASNFGAQPATLDEPIRAVRLIGQVELRHLHRSGDDP